MLWFRGSLLLEDSKFAQTRSGVSVCTVMAFIAVYLSHIGLFNFQGTKYKILRFALVFVSIIRYNITEVQFLSVRIGGKLTVFEFSIGKNRGKIYGIRKIHRTIRVRRFK